MCHKVSYDSYREASKVASSFRRRRRYNKTGQRMKRSKHAEIPNRAYRCPECGKYHITHLKTETPHGKSKYYNPIQ